jgi:hypothetical protein
MSAISAHFEVAPPVFKKPKQTELGPGFHSTVSSKYEIKHDSNDRRIRGLKGKHRTGRAHRAAQVTRDKHWRMA